MGLRFRQWVDRGFTAVAVLAVLLVVGALAAILCPMLWRGATAVVFHGTVEFRRMQLEEFHRGDRAAVEAEAALAARARQPVYDLLDRFRRGIDVSALEAEVRRLYRELGKQLHHRAVSAEAYQQCRQAAQRLRDALLAACQTTDKAEALALLDQVLATPRHGPLADTVAARYFDLAHDYRQIVQTVDLGRRATYVRMLAEVQEALTKLLGPRPGEPVPALVMDRYGATRWDQAQARLKDLLYAVEWVADGPGQKRRRQLRPRAELFAGTDLAGLFPLVEAHLREMLRPQWTFYWQFFTDDSIAGHYFGGVGPEVLGTLLITVLAIGFALPLGVVAAGFLVESAGDNLLTRLIRTCISTLAGVPSIVFGLFGLAFFVLFFLPLFGLPSLPSVLAGAMTLAILVLPVVIRSSEEAIRMVPVAYKEAALALGASRFRCFVTVTLPAALPGILTGLVLSMSRAAGETAPILFTAAIAMGPIPRSLMDPTRTLSYGSYDMAVGDRVAMLVPHQQFGMVMTLVLLVLLLNLAAIGWRARVSRKLRGQ